MGKNAVLHNNGGHHWLNGKHVAFGKVLEGMEAVVKVGRH